MKRILITRTDRIGDVILSTPVFKAVREEYPDSYIAVMVRPYTSECVEGNPYINETIIYEKRGAHRGLYGSFKFAMEIKEKGFDLAIILHPTNRMNIITFLAGIPERVGYDRKFGFLLTRRLPHDKHLGEKHEADYTMDVVRSIGITPDQKALYIPIKREKRKSMRRKLAARGISDADKLVSVHPSSSCPSKMWPPERFAGVADSLIRVYNIKIVLVGSGDSARHARAMADAMKSAAVDFTGETGIGELAWLLKRSALFISNDSGPVHISSAVGTPVIAVFGRKDKGLGPKRWGPIGLRDVILHKDAGCEQCLAHNCKREFMCLKAIDEKEVIEAAEGLLR
jgi:heptosyltransferase-2